MTTKVTKTEKPLQVRKTLQDTISYQQELQYIVRKNKDKNTPLSMHDKDRFIEIYPLAILSHGSNPCYYRTRKGGVIRFEHLDMLKYFLSEQTSNVVNIVDENSGAIMENNLPISDLWKFFERQLVYVFPYAREEAVHMSVESQLREAPASYEFSAKQ